MLHIAVNKVSEIQSIKCKGPVVRLALYSFAVSRPMVLGVCISGLPISKIPHVSAYWVPLHSFLSLGCYIHTSVVTKE